jgi:N-acyl-phosphatidylethanolamine-hydrolysing phospholipase D
MFRLLAGIVLGILLAGCAVTPDHHAGSPPKATPHLARNIGLAFHNMKVASGFYAVKVRLRAGGKRNAHQFQVPEAPARGATSISWLGHSSSLIHIGGMSILTDPVIVSHGFPTHPLPVRLAPPPFKVGELPEIDVILLSHGDYDHLHVPTLFALGRRFPDALVIAPKGVTRPLAHVGFTDFREIANGKSARIGRLKFIAQPVHHQTRRNLLGIRNGGALSWVLTDGKSKILFIGDTAYGPAFSRIGAAHGPFDAVLVPIGAFEPRELVGGMHANPEEAAQIARDVGAKLAVGIHWATFALSSELGAENERRFLAAGGQGVKTVVLKPGETIFLN